MTEPVRVYVGTEPKAEVARRVLEFSIRRHASVPVEVTPMIGPAWEYPTAGLTVGTGFSLRRWMIPAACGFVGRAVYLDADQLVFGDVAELYARADQTPGQVVWLTMQPSKFSKTPHPNTSVMVLDCAAALPHWEFQIDAALDYLRKAGTKDAYVSLMYLRQFPARLVGELPVAWNHLNVYEPGRTKLLHYTSEPSQPWYKPEHPLAHLWQAELTRAIEAGAVPRGEFEAALAKWGVKDDWRNTNGLHPYYRTFLPHFPR